MMLTRLTTDVKAARDSTVWVERGHDYGPVRFGQSLSANYKPVNQRIRKMGSAHALLHR